MLFKKHFAKFYLKYALLFIIGIYVLVTIDYLQLKVPNFIGTIIDELNEDIVNVSFIESIIKQIAVITFFVMIGRFLWRYTVFGASRRIESDLRNDMFHKATKLSQNFYNKEKVGGLMTYFINDLEAVRQSYGRGILMLVDGLTLGSIALYKMASLNYKLTIIAAIPMVILTVVMVYIRKILSAKFKERQEAFEDLSDFTQENFSGIRVIKAFVREIKEYVFFQKKNDKFYDRQINFVKSMVFINIMISLALNFVILFIVVFGSMVVINADGIGFTPGNLTEYLAYFFSLTWPVMALSQFVAIQGQASASATRIANFLDTPIDIQDQAQLDKVDHLKASIEFKHLTFKYDDGDVNVLDDVSFKIEPGEMVGILGRTGSGKSSLVDLLLRIHNLNENQLFIGGHDIMKLPVKQVRNTIGYVPQDNFLFSTTIAENISFSYDDAYENEVIRAAKLSDVYENIIEFKEGFNTILGERGVTVSGGQKQRISIARALAKNPDILVLDDSVSAVDTKTEDAIIKNLHEVRKGKTTIFIAHRISTVKKMDKIVLLENGKVIAVGSHKELLKTSPVYKDMVKRQQLESIVEGGASR
ncbi:ABC transporter ATP-binding protein/permease [Mycoplasmatota bacterium]|nr:ABC transporter ATP-binding protein/permease [Mycoplasmatota bacterium]